MKIKRKTAFIKILSVATAIKTKRMTKIKMSSERATDWLINGNGERKEGRRVHGECRKVILEKQEQPLAHQDTPSMSR